MRLEYLWFRDLNKIVLLTWQRREGGVRCGERGGECGKEAAVRAALKSEGRGAGGCSVTIEGGEEAAARLWRAVRRRQRQRGSGRRGVGGGSGSAALELGRGVGRSAVLEGGEEAVSRRDAFAVF